MDSDKLLIEVASKVNCNLLEKAQIRAKAKEHLRKRGIKNASAQIQLVGKKRMRSLNKKFLSKDSPTDVLSFPLEPIPGEKIQNIGTIFVCNDIIKKQAKEKKISYKEEFIFLVCHGLDHLIGIHHD